jgi:protein required for attachment to host cells
VPDKRLDCAGIEISQCGKADFRGSLPVMYSDTRQHHQDPTMTTWVVLTDGERLRIVEIAQPDDRPKEVDISRLAGAPPQDTLQGGHHSAAGSGARLGAGLALNASPVSAELARAAGESLAQAQRRGLFDRSVLIAPQEALGVLMDSLGADVRESLLLELEADMVEADPAVIRASLPL